MGVPEGRETRAALAQGQRYTILLHRRANSLSRPDRLARSHHPDRRRWRTPSRFKHMIQVEDGRYRRLTSRELERLNGFPDDWTLTGMPEGRRAFMMGNALVVGLIERVGAELLRALGHDATAHNAASAG